MTNRCRRVWGSSRSSALIRAWSAQNSRGRLSCRGNTFIWWRPTRIPAVVDACDPRSSATHALNRSRASDGPVSPHHPASGHREIMFARVPGDVEFTAVAGNNE